MANLHSRSNSLPSKSHPLVDDVQHHLCRLKSSKNASTSATSICKNLAGLTDLHEGINNLIHMPCVQQALPTEQCENWRNELLEGSLKLVDLCGFSRDIVCLIKESVQELESSIRRSRAETATTDHIKAYAASRKKINKMVNKCIKNLKGFNQNSTAMPNEDCDLKTIGTMLKEMESLDFSVLKSLLIVFSGEKERSNQKSWSFLSKLSGNGRVMRQQEIGAEDMCSLNLNIDKAQESMAVKDMLKKLNSSEMAILEVEEGVESLFRSLVKTRVSLLNVLNH